MVRCSMGEREERSDPQAETLIAGIKDRACNLYLTRQMLCAEAVLVAVNRGLNGGLTDAQALAMAAPFCVALGDSGCLCGALSGAVMATGLLLGNAHPYRYRKDMRDSARRLHDAFKTANGATCCRVLTKKLRHDSKAHFEQCAALTAQAAELAARLIIEKRPAVIARADSGYLARRQSGIGGALLHLVHLFSR